MHKGDIGKTTLIRLCSGSEGRWQETEGGEALKGRGEEALQANVPLASEADQRRVTRSSLRRRGPVSHKIDMIHRFTC